MDFEALSRNTRIAVVGLGYVGLPVAIAFARRFPTIGFDVDPRRISTLRNGHDWTGEVSAADLAASSIRFEDDPQALADCNFIVVAVPTPVDENHSPDFSLLRKACQLLGPVIRPGVTVVFESTVYPGATEDICGPELERWSGLACGKDFKLGYSPERINPGDHDRPLERIVKIVSGQDQATLDLLAEVYGSIIDAGVHRASSIKVAEAAKVLENTQRDINIALMNEMSKICDLLDIRTSEVLKAAGTKWNFLNFTPGLVGGHCIGVDPYYLTTKAEQLGYHPEMILAGRRINDNMPSYVAGRIVRMLAVHDMPVRRATVGILGMTFKENVPDIRNSKVAELHAALTHYGIAPRASDPLADPAETLHEYGITLENGDDWQELDVVILAVPHRSYMSDAAGLVRRVARKGAVIIDLKSVIDPAALRPDLTYWSL